MSSDTEQMLARFARHPLEFAASNTVDEFVSRLGTDKPGDGAVIAQYVAHPESWTRYLWRTAKAHGLDAAPHRPLYVPEAKSLSELVEDVRYLPTPEGGLYRDQALAAVGGRMFISGSRSPRDEIPFGSVGGKRDWSPRFAGERVRRHMGGKTYATYGRPAKPLLDAWNRVIDDSRGSLATLELIRWDDGRTLCVARHVGGIFTLWAALLSPGSANAVELMPPEDRALIETERQAERAAWGD
jgi:hypothetical protein